jgi:hypothetical protein
VRSNPEHTYLSKERKTNEQTNKQKRNREEKCGISEKRGGE